MHKTLKVLFPILMVLNGVVDLTMPGALKDAMDSLSLPHYMLIILGIAKMSGGLALLLPVPPFLREWAFAGFFVWCLGGLAAHALSGDPPTHSLPLLVLGILLILTYRAHHKEPADPGSVSEST